jgi:beta-glucanase (GH16 family)
MARIFNERVRAQHARKWPKVTKYSRGRSLRRAFIAVPALLAVLSACGAAGAVDGGNAGSNSSSVDLQAAPVPSNAVSDSSAQKWKLTWEDDFTGSGLPRNWSPIVSGNGFSDHSLAWFSDDNARLTGHGGLVITADKGGSQYTCWYGPCEYESADIQTSFAQEYGRFEARIKLPSGKGLWPGFWMIPQRTVQNPVLPGEIDILEVNSSNPIKVSGYAHDGPIFDYEAKEYLSQPVSSQFHVFGVDWTPTGITWTLDGKPYGHVNAYKNWPFDRPYIMLLTLAVGGDWAGTPPVTTVFPAQLQVSWVRVYQMVN